MCDWPVYGIYRSNPRRCDFTGIHQAGPLSVCARHLDTLVSGVLDAMQGEARQMLGEGRRTPGGIEEEMRFALGELDKTRRAAMYASEGRQPCIYFAEREGYVKIGTTVNLAERMRAVAAGASILPGMTAGPVTLLATMPGDLSQELRLHRRFYRLRVDRNREWFRHEGKLRELIEELQAAA